jgi:hypothetical protein
MKPFPVFLWRITSAHVITYTLVGIFASQFLNYQELFESAPYSSFMRPVTSSAVAVGPALQLFRGLIFSIALWPFKDIILNTRYGWLKLWGLLIGLSILSTTAAAPGSVEGFIYTSIPIQKQVIGYTEVLPQTLLFSLIVYYWYKKPKKAWNIISIVLVSIVLLISILALTLPRP